MKGKRFTFQTTPAGAWDGIIHCQVLEVMPNERLVYAWKSGHEGNVGYGAALDTVVTWTLSKVETARAFALSIPASSRRRTIRPSRTWAKAGRRLSDKSATITAEQDSSKPKRERAPKTLTQSAGWRRCNTEGEKSDDEAHDRDT